MPIATQAAYINFRRFAASPRDSPIIKITGKRNMACKITIYAMDFIGTAPIFFRTLYDFLPSELKSGDAKSRAFNPMTTELTSTYPKAGREKRISMSMKGISPEPNRYIIEKLPATVRNDEITMSNKKIDFLVMIFSALSDNDPFISTRRLSVLILTPCRTFPVV